MEYTAMKPTPLEIAESIDMMRIIENGLKVRMVPTSFQSHSVDTPNDLKKVEKKLAKEQGEVDKTKIEVESSQVPSTAPDSKTPVVEE